MQVHTQAPGHKLVLKNRISELFCSNIELRCEKDPDFTFDVRQGAANEVELFKNGEHVVSGKSNDLFFNFAETRIRLAVAEHAADHVFIHAGVVSYRGRGIVIPGMSMSGKTTLTRALLASGADYLSDEYAVVDRKGMLIPFPKPLSIRANRFSNVQTDHRVEDLGGSIANGACEPALVLFTSFSPESEWNPLPLTSGSGVLKLLEHTLPIRRAPKFSFQILDKFAKKAKFYKSCRPEASEAVEGIVELLETTSVKH